MSSLVRTSARANALAMPVHDTVIEKIVDGKMDKFYSTQCLVEQAFIKNPDQTINQIIAEKNKALGENIAIRKFIRYMVGEEVAGEVPATELGE